MKQLKLAAAARLDLFFEAYNLFELGELREPDRQHVIDKLCDSHRGARNPRQLQWGARFTF